MPVTPRELTFAALFAYYPRGTSETARKSQRLGFELKRDGFIRSPSGGSGQRPQSVSDWVAERIRDRRTRLPFANFFGPDTTLVPMPTHSRRDEGAMWVPMRLCEAFARAGLGEAVLPLVVRTRAVPKAALARPEERPTVEQHLASISIERSLKDPEEILLVDDVVTRGATFMAASIRLVEVFPRARVRAFAVMRTISDSEGASAIESPRVGTISLYESGKTHREP